MPSLYRRCQGRRRAVRRRGELPFGASLTWPTSVFRPALGGVSVPNGRAPAASAAPRAPRSSYLEHLEHLESVILIRYFTVRQCIRACLLLRQCTTAPYSFVPGSALQAWPTTAHCRRGASQRCSIRLCLRQNSPLPFRVVRRSHALNAKNPVSLKSIGSDQLAARRCHPTAEVPLRSASHGVCPHAWSARAVGRECVVCVGGVVDWILLKPCLLCRIH